MTILFQGFFRADGVFFSLELSPASFENEGGWAFFILNPNNLKTLTNEKTTRNCSCHHSDGNGLC